MGVGDIDGGEAGGVGVHPAAEGGGVLAEPSVVEAGFGVALVAREFVSGDAGIADRVKRLDLDVVVVNGSAPGAEVKVNTHQVGVVRREVESDLLPRSTCTI